MFEDIVAIKLFGKLSKKYNREKSRFFLLKTSRFHRFLLLFRVITIYRSDENVSIKAGLRHVNLAIAPIFSVCLRRFLFLCYGCG